MGLFSSIARKIGRGIEIFGDKFHREKISNFGRSVQNLFSEQIGILTSYNPESSNVSTVEDLSKILASFSEELYKEAEHIENKCIKFVRDYYDILIEILEEISDEEGIKPYIKILKIQKGQTGNLIKGRIYKPLSKKLSLDNTECVNILKLQSGFAKKQAMKDFSTRVIKSSLNHLSVYVKDILTEQTDDVIQCLDSLAEQQEERISYIILHLRSITEQGQRNADEISKKFLESFYITSVSATVCNLLNT